MDDLCRSGDTVSLIVSGDCANHAIVNEQVLVAAVHGVNAAYAQGLGNACRLAGCDMYQKQ